MGPRATGAGTGQATVVATHGAKAYPMFLKLNNYEVKIKKDRGKILALWVATTVAWPVPAPVARARLPRLLHAGPRCFNQ